MPLQQTIRPSQRSALGGQLNSYLMRIVPDFLSPRWLEASQWRYFVQNQPIAVTCRETLIAQLIALDWRIIARDSEKQDELKPKIEQYTKLIQNIDAYYSDLDYTSLIEWVAKDLLDLPFGGFAEIGRENDEPEGDVLWIRPVDASTLVPTLNYDFPVAQVTPTDIAHIPIIFPRHACDRIYYSPRSEIRREGWGMAPPEKVFLAMSMLGRGDKYYAELLLNVPEAGILDLMDMDKDSANEWVNSWADAGNGTNPFKIPVLYEHTQPAKFLSFGKMPNDLMFDRNIMRYAAVVCAAYGMSLSDIGLGSSSSSGGETLSGTIRQERKTRKTGFAVLCKKMMTFFDRMLPPDLHFSLIDYDDELQVALGRARLANAQANEINIRQQVISPDEARLQSIQDGLFTITMPEKLDRDKVEWPISATERFTGQLGNSGSKNIGNPVPPSKGGQGEIIDKPILRRSLADDLYDVFDSVQGRAEAEVVFSGSDLGVLNAKEKIESDVDIDIAQVVEHFKAEVEELLHRQEVETRLSAIENKNSLLDMLTGQQSPQPINVNVTLPEIQPSPVNLTLPPMSVSVEPTPIHNMVSVEPTPLTVQNMVSTPDVTVNNQVEPTPIQNTINVEPTPIENVVKVPKSTPEVTVNFKQGESVTTVKRDRNGNIIELETKEG